MATNDYEELDLFIDEETPVTFLIHFRDREVLDFPGVNHNPIRVNDYWVISHTRDGLPATSYVPVDRVWYFTVL